jgi:hypothetical protein
MPFAQHRGLHGAGDNPRIVHHKLLTFFVAYRAPVRGAQRPEQKPAEEVQVQLEQQVAQDLAAMDYGEIAALFTDMAYLRRRVGLHALHVFAERATYPTLRVGLERIAAGDSPAQIMTALESRLNDMLRESRLRYQATIAGALAVQKGCTPDETVEKIPQQAIEQSTA